MFVGDYCFPNLNGPSFANLYQAKLSCSLWGLTCLDSTGTCFNSTCNRILDNGCKGDDLRLCVDNMDANLPYTIEQIEGSCIHSKKEVHGIYNNIK